MKLNTIVAAAALAAAGAAHADISLLDSSMYGTLSGTNAGAIGGVAFTSAAGNFITQTIDQAATDTLIFSNVGANGKITASTPGASSPITTCSGNTSSP